MDDLLADALSKLAPPDRRAALRAWLEGRPAGEDLDETVRALVATDLLDPDDRARALGVRGRPQITTPEQAVRPVAPAGTVLRGAFALLGEVGRGAMGTVHVARDLVLRRKVAYKQLTGPLVGDARRDFVAEAQITAQLDHPNVVPVYHLAVPDDGPPAYAMKLVDGSTLQDLVEEAADRPDDASALAARLEVFLKICEGLAYAHARGVIHCDLKPANVMVGAFGEVYVMDWGIARRLGDPPPEVVRGTPSYMSPEQAHGQAVGAASDQYALGLLLQELVTLSRARPPSGNLARSVMRASRGDREPMVHHHPRTPIAPELVAIVDRATRVAPDQRYPDVTALAADVRRHLRGEAVSVLPDGAWRRLVRTVARRPGAALAVALGVVLVVVTFSSAATVSSLQAAVDADQEALWVTAQLGAVERRAGAVETEILRFGRLLEGISTATTVALSQTQPEAARPWLVDDAATTAADLVDSPWDGAAVSLAVPVFRSAPGADPLALQPVFGRLTRLDGTLRRVVLRSAKGGAVTWDLPEAQRRYVAGETPVRRVRVALNDGTELVFPGQVEAAAEDPRETEWYRRSAGQAFPHWEAPLLDGRGRVTVICGRSIYAEDDPRFLGVAAAEIVLDRVVPELLAERDQGLVRQWLVDARGRVVASDEGPGGLVDVPLEDVTELLDDHLTTWRAEDEGGIVVTTPLPTLGLALVARYREDD